MTTEPAAANIVAQILLLAILTMINAFFSCAEMATVSVNKNKISMLAENKNKKAILVQNLLKEPTKFLSTIQVMITLAGFLASASAATGISQYLDKFLNRLHVPYSNQISLVVITLILSYFTLVFGELVPKRIALQKAEAISLASVKTIYVISKIASPFIKLLSASTNLILHILGMKTDDLEEKVSKEEIKSLVEAGQAHGVFNKYEKDMIYSIFEFDDIVAREIMTPRTEVYAIDINEPFSEYLDELLETRHSRIPVYDDNIDNIIGILYVKDYFLEARKHGFEHVNLRPLLHKPYLVPESKNIDELFKELQKSKKYIAILIDEYGGFSGIVTVEDLVEEVMGDIEDEYDEEEPAINKISDDTYIIDGLYSIDDLNEQLCLNISSENHDTISGLLIDIIGTIPDEGDNSIIELENMIFEIINMKDNRIEKVKLVIQEKKEPELVEEED